MVAPGCPDRLAAGKDGEAQQVAPAAPGDGWRGQLAVPELRPLRGGPVGQGPEAPGEGRGVGGVGVGGEVCGVGALQRPKSELPGFSVQARLDRTSRLGQL